MSRRFVAAVIAAIVLALLAGVAIGTVTAQEENYEGESTCEGFSAWPGGSHLSQMHPFHFDFYFGYAERRDWYPCAAWAADQMRSAIRGLRAAGFTVEEPQLTYGRPYGATTCEWDDEGLVELGKGNHKWYYLFGDCLVNGEWIRVWGATYRAENTAEGFYVYWYDVGPTRDSLGRTFVPWAG